MRQYVKSAFRSVRKNVSKLIAILGIVLLGVAFVGGLGTLSPTIERSYSDYLISHNAPDIVLKSKTGSFSDEEKAKIEDIQNVKMKDTAAILELENAIDEAPYRFHVLDPESEVNELDLKEGELPKETNEVLALKPLKNMQSLKVGDLIEFEIPLEVPSSSEIDPELLKGIEEFLHNLKLEDYPSIPPDLIPVLEDILSDFEFGTWEAFDLTIPFEMKVSGLVEDPLMFSKDYEPSLLDQDVKIAQAIYVVSEELSFIRDLMTTDARIVLEWEKGTHWFTDKYDERILEIQAALEEELGDNVAVLTYNENKSAAYLIEISEKIDVITLIFPAFFIIIAVLVVMTTVGRMVEEDRSVIGCLKTQGLSDFSIASKYLYYATFCSIVGSALGMLVGLFLLPAVIYPAFEAMFVLPVMSGFISPNSGLISGALIMVTSILSAGYVSFRSLRSEPAELLRPAAPKAGRKTLIERIPFIWKPMPFRWKSSIRNIFRFKKRLAMIVLSILGSTALIFAGLSLLNISMDVGNEKLSGLGDTLIPIALVIIFFAVFLTAFVIYNLTNMTVGERNREIATVDVLGYKSFEVLGYVYREIFVMVVFGVLLGIPTGLGLTYFIFTYMEFGGLEDIAWWCYLCSGLIVIFFVGLIDLILMRKVLGVDMNASLKSVD